MHNTHKQILFFASTLLFLALLIWLTNINQWVFLNLNLLGSQLPHWLWSNITLMGDTMMAVSLLLIVASIKREVFTQGILLLILGGLSVYLSKQYFDVSRPAAVLPVSDFNLIGHLLKYNSFPSGHSFTAMSMVSLFILQVQRKWFTYAGLIVGLIFALSRVMVGAHWPLDVLVGSALGIIIACFCVVISQHLNLLKHKLLERFYALIMSLTMLSFPFYESHYPQTIYLQCVVSVLALFIVMRHYWWPILSGEERREAQWQDINFTKSDYNSDN